MVALFVILLFAWMAIKLMLLRTAVMWGGSLFMGALILFLAAVAISFIAVRARGARA